ncbi:hypothetical protein EBB07_14565 [Paenibacillaceae bacterium]|nr:hypothetical protein EBB07_14565 [Paenibacillaceae bacterium]
MTTKIMPHISRMTGGRGEEMYIQRKAAAFRLAIGLLCGLLVAGLVPMHDVHAAEDVVLKPSASAYARSFVAESEGQQWFLREVERLLNVQERSLNTIKSKQDLEDIVSLGFYNRGIKGKIPKAIGELSSLRYLFLGSNQLEGNMPKELFKLTKLESLDLSNNKLNGSLPKEVGALTNLRVLLLWNNGFTGPIPGEWGNLSKLENLDLAGNRLTGRIPSELSQLGKLKLLALSGNPFDPQPLPQWLDELSELQVALLWNTRLTGEIPTSYSNLRRLQVLDVSQNQLTGALPASLSGLTDMRRLAASDNRLTGTLPAGYSAMSKLTVLDMANNDLSGSIPASYGAFEQLSKLTLSGNRLGGSIPAIWQAMADLTLVDLANNQFVGHVPADLGQKEAAGVVVDLQHNYVTGPVAAGMKRQNDNFIDNAGTKQMRLKLPGYIQLRVGETVNLYERFTVIDARSNQTNSKAKLPPSAYKLSLQGLTEEEAEELIELQEDAQGLYVKLLKALPQNQAVSVVLAIAENSGSNYSRTVTSIGSEAAPSTGGGGSGGGGGGGGGGGSSSPGAPETTVPPVKPQPPVEPNPTAVTGKHERYIHGYLDGTIRPNGTLTREEVAVMLGRLIVDEVSEKEGTSSYPDVEASRWSARYIAALTEKKLMAGYPDGTFRPKAPISRAEVAVLIARMELHTKKGTALSFPDVPAAYWAASGIASVTEAGWMQGYPDRTFRPAALMTRAEFAKTINSVMGRKPDRDDIMRKGSHSFKDLSSSHWAYEQLLEAALTHTYTLQDDEHWETILP